MTQGSKGGVQSVEIGIGLLKTLAAMGGKVSLNQLSEETGMHPAKVHRYLTSLVSTGLVARTAHGKYDLGSYGLEFSTLYLSRLDPSAVANEMMESLRDQTAEGVILTVWGSAGTTVIRWFQSRQPISVGIRPGTCFSTLMSASGRVFMSYLPAELTQPQIEQELSKLEKKPHRLAPQGWDQIRQIKAETRQYGLGRVEGHSAEGVSALAAPIFDYRGELVLSLALFGFKNRFDADWDGRNAQLLRQTAGEVSTRLGYIVPG